MNYHSINIINDCYDSPTQARQTVRISSLFGITPNFVAIDSYSDIQASGILIDLIDASLGIPGIFIVNCAPRHGAAKKWPNGTPFCFFKIGESLILSSIDGHTLSLVKKFKLAQSINVVDIPEVMKSLIGQNLIGEKTADHIIKTQFRSFEFLPRLAKWLNDGVNIPFVESDIASVSDIDHCIWHIDNFGNCKTTILPKEVGFAVGKKLKTKYGEFECFTQLRDLPDNTTGFTIGSSGLGSQRFVEFVTQGENNAAKYGLKVGDGIL